MVCCMSWSVNCFHLCPLNSEYVALVNGEKVAVIFLVKEFGERSLGTEDRKLRDSADVVVVPVGYQDGANGAILGFQDRGEDV